MCAAASGCAFSAMALDRILPLYTAAHPVWLRLYIYSGIYTAAWHGSQRSLRGRGGCWALRHPNGALQLCIESLRIPRSLPHARSRAGSRPFPSPRHAWPVVRALPMARSGPMPCAPVSAADARYSTRCKSAHPRVHQRLGCRAQRNSQRPRRSAYGPARAAAGAHCKLLAHACCTISRVFSPLPCPCLRPA